MRGIKLFTCLCALVLLFSFSSSVQATSVDQSSCQHEFGEWKTVCSSLCTKKGLKKRICKKCKYAESQSIDAKGHKYSKKWREPSKKLSGCYHDIKVKVCSRCGDVKVKDNAKKDGKVKHKGGKSWKTLRKATCEYEGVKVKKCKRCGDVVEVVEKKQKAHKWGSYFCISEMTCTSQSQYRRRCKSCGVFDSTVMNHNSLYPDRPETPQHKWYSVWDDNGTEYQQCRVCGVKQQ